MGATRKTAPGVRQDFAFRFMLHGAVCRRASDPAGARLRLGRRTRKGVMGAQPTLAPKEGPPRCAAITASISLIASCQARSTSDWSRKPDPRRGERCASGD